MGNRVYTGAGVYRGVFAIPGPQLEAIEAQISVMVRANDALEQFHRQWAAASA